MKKEREQKTEQAEETAILDENMARLTLLSELALPKDSDMGKVYASDPNANAKLKKMFKDKTWNAKKVNVKLIHEKNYQVKDFNRIQKWKQIVD